ncbi:hypothetical protein Ahy_A01g004413 isoform B [Arachis hypogaea]|uniref:Uncharacterized protein n=1 Tax=Arachis hypogaea TaxID=3818 RepID=A0A445EW12_ARAHY|nr:hypothetical protein Ahy_A01g004413 isoform B [Arachis hypogaea]
MVVFLFSFALYTGLVIFPKHDQSFNAKYVEGQKAKIKLEILVKLNFGAANFVLVTIKQTQPILLCSHAPKSSLPYTFAVVSMPLSLPPPPPYFPRPLVPSSGTHIF